VVVIGPKFEAVAEVVPVIKNKAYPLVAVTDTVVVVAAHVTAGLAKLNRLVY
jgi:hypothetical protein